MAMKAEQRRVDDELDLDDDGEEPPDIEQLRAVIARSDAQIERGEVYPIEVILDDMRRIATEK